jgi:predicted DNA repair protein MutK
MSGGLFALLDDIVALMDDVAVMGKVATKKTAGILGDDLAVNANKAAGFPSERELPVLWAIMKGSFLNKIILLPIAFLLSAFAPSLIIPILMLGGVYLAFEGTEKILEWLSKRGKRQQEESDSDSVSQDESLDIEKRKIRSAILTDFILSIEIVIIALGAVAEKALSIQIPVVTVVAFLATIGVYGLVAFIVRLDDMGYALLNMENSGRISRALGRALVSSLPIVVRLLTVIGTLAMLLVAGGIFIHNIESLHGIVDLLPVIVAELFVGFVVGIAAVGLIWIFERVMNNDRV